MNRTHLAALAVAVTALLIPSGSLQADAPPPTNVVFILADDLGINDLGCYGRKEHQTPNLDKLATQGLRFTQAYVQPLCSPTRAALLTGRDSARLHITTFLPGRADAPSQKMLHPKINTQLPPDVKTVAELLRADGYATACIGKWHVGGSPKERGFDLVHAGMANTKPSDTEGGKGEYDLTDKAEKFLSDNKDRPFFLYLAHNNPHIPLAAKPELIAQYKDTFNPTYAAMIRTLDDSVGRILAKLDALGLTERTLVVFMSDNGGLHVPEGVNTPATHNTPFRAGKGFLYEGGIRVPLIVRWPGKTKPGETVTTPVHVTDWTPTLLDVCGVKAAGLFDGVSLAVLLRGDKLAARTLYWHFPHYSNQGGRPGGAVREDDWKLLEWYEDGRVELFDLSRDPGETTDRSATSAEMAEHLRRKLAAWRKAVGAQEMSPNPNFDAVLHKKLYVDIDVSQLKPAATAAEMRPKLDAWREGMAAAVRPR
jgi:arylsulfatase A-like enzyme